MMDLPAMVAATAAPDLPRLIGELEAAKAAAWARLAVPLPGRCPDGGHDENLPTDEAARRLGMSERWLYRNASRLPFTVRIGRRLVFSARGLDRWLERQRPGA